MKKLILLLCLTITTSVMKAQNPPIPRDVLTFLMGEHKRAEHLQKDNNLLKEDLRTHKLQVSNYVFQISKYKVDSTANAEIRKSLNHSLLLREEEFIQAEQKWRKEVNRWKGNTVIAGVIAVLALLAAVLF